MTVCELFAVQRDNNKLKSLYLELANHENFNPYKSNIISDMPRGGSGGKNFEEWYIEEKERIEREIEFYKQKIQEDRKLVEEFISSAPYPECDIIRFRVINDLSWFEIGELVGYHRTKVSKKFYAYIKSSQSSFKSCKLVVSKDGRSP